MKISTALRYAISTSLFLFAWLLNGQRAPQAYNWQLPDERLLVESKWRYTYTLHATSNTIIHRAGQQYDYYLYFRFDYSYQQYLNGSLSLGTWSLDGRTLYYSFQNVDRFTIAELTPNKLILEFDPPNGKGTFQYHFVRVSTTEAPFPRPANELPEVIVEASKPSKKSSEKTREGLFSWLRKKDKAETRKEDLVEINIELIGGGYYGGIDPVVKDYIRIKSDGRLIQEFQSLNGGLYINKKNIPREELEQFIEWVAKQGFFKMQRIYDCTDPLCFQRKAQKPTPIPLRLSITYGNVRKVVTVAIWGEDERKIRYVDYPIELDAIIDAIQRMAHRLEEPLVRK